MPHIEHIALWVDDIELICSFYSRFFAASIGVQYENKAKGFTSRFLSFDTGARIEVMSTTILSPVRLESGAQRIGLTHLAIALGSKAEVDSLTQTLKSAGVAIIDGPRRTGDGYYESVVLDPEGNRIELVADRD